MAETIVAPASELTANPAWKFDSETNLSQKLSDRLLQQRPRAWDRIPKSPFASKRNGRAKGRKVWKRFEVPLKDKTNETAGQMFDGAGDVESGGFGENAHATKRLRSKGAAGVQSEEEKPSRYVTTLRDKVPGTPRRKMASRRSLKPDRLIDLGNSVADAEAGKNSRSSPRKMASRRYSRARRSSTLAVNETPVVDPQEISTGTPKTRGTSRRSLRSGRNSIALTADSHEVVTQHEASPKELLKNDEPPAETSVIDVAELDVLEEEDVNDNQTANDATERMDCLEEEPIHEIATDPVQPTPSPLLEDIEEALNSPLLHEPIEDNMLDIADSHNLQPSELGSDKNLCSSWNHETVRVGKTNDHELILDATTEELAQAHGQHEQDEVTSELIYTELNVDKDQLDEVPPQSQTMDTVEDNTVGSHSPTDVRQMDQALADFQSASTSPKPILRRSSRRLSEKKMEAAVIQLAAVAGPTSTPTDTMASEEIVGNLPAIGQEGEKSTSEENSYGCQEPALDQHLQREFHEDMIDENIVSGDTDMLDTPPVEQAGISDVDLDASKSSAPDERVKEVEFGNAEDQSAKSPQVKSRSRTRFSDDTTMLKDFLSRAQARKLARDAAPTADLPTAMPSPRRSSRKGLGNLDGKSPTRKPCELANRPGTPPGKEGVEANMHAAENAETVAQASPVRRSTRKRVAGPAPAKTTTGAPSFIPVRRADGTDPVKLQKSVAQELAHVTQTNTRRNKGQAKPPAMILKTLTLEHYEEATKGGHALRNCKNVGWDKKLVYYQDGTEAIVSVASQPEETRPKARRLRGLGAGNGTPAPKRKTTDMLSCNGTPGSKRQGRIR
ncbi:MAG: hypothetical protein Q9203_006929 [Teloschistes exilis]